MKEIQSIEFFAGSKEELLPGFSDDFPYIASRVDPDQFIGGCVPWHWHRTVELFYIESGCLEYCTPGGNWRFPAGSGGMVNSNVLHMTRAIPETGGRTIQLLHMFDLSLISGAQGSRIEKNYVAPLVAAPNLEILPLFPENEAENAVLKLITEAFHISGESLGYEIKLREILSEIWLKLFQLSAPLPERKGTPDRNNDKIKLMMAYIHEHYQEKISISQLAASAYLSERECFRAFRNCLHMTPAEYLKAYRLQTACRMLASGKESITAVSQACGLGSSSYFGKVFRGYACCTPSEYRKKWQDCDNSGQERHIFSAESGL